MTAVSTCLLGFNGPCGPFGLTRWYDCQSHNCPGLFNKFCKRTSVRLKYQGLQGTLWIFCIVVEPFWAIGPYHQWLVSIHQGLVSDYAGSFVRPFILWFCSPCLPIKHKQNSQGMRYSRFQVMVWRPFLSREPFCSTSQMFNDYPSRHCWRWWWQLRFYVYNWVFRPLWPRRFH